MSRHYTNIASLLSISTLIFVGIHKDVQAKTISAQSSVEIIENLYLTETQSMSFGVLAVSASTSEIISLTPLGTVTSSSSAQAQGGAQNARFTASGTPNALITMSFNNGTLSGSGTDMTLTNFSHDAGLSPTLNSSGALDINVGADLHLNADQGIGLYNGTYQITVNYQ